MNFRIASVLFPPDQETLAKITQQGYKDAWRFLQTRFTISTELILNKHTHKDKEHQLRELQGFFDQVNIEDPSIKALLLKLPLGSKVVETSKLGIEYILVKQLIA